MTMQSHSRITKPLDRKNLSDFFPITMEKNSFSEKNFHKYVPMEVFRVNMRSAFEDALQRAYPVPIDWDSDWGTMVEDTGEGHNFFDINRKAMAYGLKVGESYIDTKEGIVSSRDRNEEKERRKRLIISFRTFLIDNVKSTKWSMIYSPETEDKRFSAEGIMNTAKEYRNTALFDAITTAASYGIGKGLEKFGSGLAEVGIKSNKTGVLSKLQSKKLMSDNVNFLNVGFDWSAGKLRPKNGIEVGVNNEWSRGLGHKMNKVAVRPLEKMGCTKMAGYVEKRLNDNFDSAMEISELAIGALFPHYAIANLAVSAFMNGTLALQNYFISEDAKKREEESDEAWSKLWCDFIIEDIEGMTNNDLCELGKMLNIQMQNHEWLKDRNNKKY